MSANEQTEVLVVGAGPTGLTLAAALARVGVRTRVIDRGAGRTDKSKAIGVQAGSLEALGDFFGDELSGKMVAAGFSAREFFAEFGQRESLRVDLSQIPSRFNYILVLPQSYTEQFLEEELASSLLAVGWRKELVTLDQNGSTVTARLQGATGQTEELTCDFIVGCDGAHSTVRHQLGIPFSGSAYEGNFVLGDVVLRWPWPYDAGRALISERGIVACFPMSGEQGAYRLIVAAKGPAETTSPDISPDDFCSAGAARGNPDRDLAVRVADSLPAAPPHRASVCERSRLSGRRRRPHSQPRRRTRHEHRHSGGA